MNRIEWGSQEHRTAMQMCPVKECIYCKDYETCQEVAEHLDEPAEWWETNCFLSDYYYLNCDQRLEARQWPEEARRE